MVIIYGSVFLIFARDIIASVLTFAYACVPKHFSWISCISILSINLMRQCYLELYNHVFGHDLWIRELWDEIYDKTGRSAALASTRLKNYFYLIHIYFSLCIYFAIYSFNLYFSLRLWHIINSMGANDSHTILHIYLVCMIIWLFGVYLCIMINFISTKASAFLIFESNIFDVIDSLHW